MGPVRKRTPILVGSAILALSIPYCCLRESSCHPSGTIRLQDNTTNKDLIIATVILTNCGTSSFTYDSGFGDVYRVATREGGLTNWQPAFARTTTPMVVWPSSSRLIRIDLPANTKAWRCAIPVEGASPRARVFTRLCEWGNWNRAQILSSWLIRLFPLNGVHSTEIQSEVFEIAEKSAQ